MSMGAVQVLDYRGHDIFNDLLASGPYKAIYAATDFASEIRTFLVGFSLFRVAAVSCLQWGARIVSET
jgi:hypothetical protein